MSGQDEAEQRAMASWAKMADAARKFPSEGEYETVQEIEPKRRPTCIITNCRRRMVKGTGLCRKHQD